MRLRAAWWVLWVLGLRLLAVPPVGAFENEPDGLGPVRFGMSVQEVQGLVPGLERMTPVPTASLEEPVVLEVFQRTGESVLGLEGCTVRYYFANDRLYQLAFDCAPSAELLFPLLKETFGPATQELDGNIYWLSLRRAVALNPRTRVFTFVDRPLNDEVGRAMAEVARLQALRRARGEAPEGTGGEEDPATPTTERRTSEPGGDDAATAAGSAEPADAADAGAPARAGEGAAVARVEPTPDEVIEAFDWFDEEKQLQELLRRLDAAATDEERAQLLYDIATYENEDAVPRVAPYLRSKNDDVAEAAVSTLEDIKGEAAVEAIGSLLGDAAVPKARKLRAIEAFTYLRAEDGVAAQLARALDDPDPEVRREAAMTIALTADDSAVPALRAVLEKERDEETRLFLERAVELLSGPGAGEAEMGRAREKARQVLWGQPGS